LLDLAHSAASVGERRRVTAHLDIRARHARRTRVHASDNAAASLHISGLSQSKQLRALTLAKSASTLRRLAELLPSFGPRFRFLHVSEDLAGQLPRLRVPCLSFSQIEFDAGLAGQLGGLQVEELSLARTSVKSLRLVLQKVSGLKLLRLNEVAGLEVSDVSRASEVSECVSLDQPHKTTLTACQMLSVLQKVRTVDLSHWEFGSGPPSHVEIRRLHLDKVYWRPGAFASMLGWACGFPLELSVNDARAAGTKSDPLSTRELDSALESSSGGELRGLSWGSNPLSLPFAKFVSGNARLTWLSLPDCAPKVQVPDAVLSALAEAVGQLGELRQLLIGGRPRHTLKATVVEVAQSARQLENLEIIHADLGDEGLSRLLSVRTNVLALRFPGSVSSAGVSALLSARFHVRYPRGLRKVLKAEELVKLKASFAAREHAEGDPDWTSALSIGFPTLVLPPPVAERPLSDDDEDWRRPAPASDDEDLPAVVEDSSGEAEQAPPAPAVAVEAEPQPEAAEGSALDWKAFPVPPVGPSDQAILNELLDFWNPISIIERVPKGDP
jgi:hypothetical protein